MNFAKANGRITLEMTTSGKVLETVGKIVPYKYTSPLWDALSRRFAQGASGTVDFFKGAWEGRTWSQIEKPILEEKGVNIITHQVNP